MSKNKYEGQMDFLGLLNEYTDSQGATVRVREPAGVKLKPVEKASSKFSVKEAEPEQLKLNLEDFVAVKAEKPASDGTGSAEILFKQCKKCWCFDCKHNSRNEGVPRDICGTQMPCPACESCISEDQATICEIGNAKEGCRLRAQEEGILIPEEPA